MTEVGVGDRLSIRASLVIPLQGPALREPWLSKRQIADYLGRSTRWVELGVCKGLSSKMIGGRRGFKLSEVEAWIDGWSR